MVLQKKWVMLLSILIGVLIVGISLYLSSDKSTYENVDGRNQWNTDGPLIRSVDQVMQYADLVVYGKIKGKSIRNPLDITTQEGSFENAVLEKSKQKGKTFNFPDVNVINLSIIEVLFGENPNVQDIKILQSEAFEVESAPMRQGDKMIFILVRVESEANTYVLIDKAASLFLVDDKEKVTPVYNAYEFSEFNNLSIRDFKQKIEKYNN